MERILSVEQMTAADEFTIKKLGFSQEELINRAGSALADEIRKRLPGGRVLVCMGKGNNGKDGRVCADILSKIHGYSVASISVANGIFKLFDKKFDIIVDCIFGTGLNRTVEGKYKEAIDRINNSGAFVVSCDIPSGLNGNTGKAMGTCVKANLTVAIQEFKFGHFLNDGPDYCGEVVAKDIGISIWGEDYAKRINASDVATIFPKRLKNTNKGDYGKSAIIGGSKDYPSSTLLSLNAISSLKMGNGYEYLLVPESIYVISAFVSPECITKALKCDGNNIVFEQNDYKNVLDCNSIAFGMGVGVNPENYKIIEFLLNNYTGNLILDADALNTIAKYGVDILKNKKCSVIVTPHIKEFSRLTGLSIEEIENNSVNLAVEFAKKYGVIVALKSATTIITNGTEYYLNTTGNSGMAKAGSGDVLTGIIAGITAKKVDLFFGVICACFLFGYAGDILEKETCPETMVASEIIATLPKAIQALC